MKRKVAILSVTVLLLLACSLFTPATKLPAATPSEVQNPTQVTAEAKPVTPSPVPPPEIQFGVIARGHIEALTAIGARFPGTQNERSAEQYIIETFTKLGYTPVTQTFNAWDEEDAEYLSENVIAVKPGDSPKEIIVGAHYDSGSEGLGADDNASGVGVMLEVAERIAKMQTPYTIRFIAFGSEENDLDGSYYYAELMKPAEVANTIAYVNLDSLAAGDITYVYSDEGPDAFLRDWTLAWAGQNNLPLQTIWDVDLLDEGDYVADYGAFSDKGIPYIYFEATNWNLGGQDGYTQVDPQYGDEGYIWHTKYDTLAYLDATFPGRVNEHMRIFTSTLFAVCTEFQQ
jgi:hypothetical protein